MKRRRRARAPDVPSQAPQRAAPRRDRLRIAIALLAFVTVFVTLAVVAHSQKSGTWDEPMHLASGYVALTDGNYFVDPTHPPFARMWAALPLVAMSDISVDRAALKRTSSPEWPHESYEFARRFVYVDNDADRLLFAARNMVVSWGVVLGVLLFAWTYEWLGFWPAAAALLFYTLEPNLGAHASLVTTDFGVTCAMFGAVYFLWRVCRRATALSVAGLSLFAAAAIVTKFSGLILLPVILLVLALAVFRLRTLSMRQAAAIAAIMALTLYTSVWAIYGFHYAPAGATDQVLRFTGSALAQQNTPWLATVVGWVDGRHLLPNAYTQGLVYSQATVRQLPAYLAGDYSMNGWWYYFPVAFLLKTPAALLLLLAAGLVLLVRQRIRLDTPSLWFVVVPPAVYLTAAMTSGINIGLRHILPIYPFVLIAAAATATQLLSSTHRAPRIAFATLMAVWVASITIAYPHRLSFFNWFVGGPANGFRFLSDSNVDWGQDLKLLKRWMGDNAVTHINLAYFGTADPAYYGIDCTHLPGAPTFAVPYITRPRLPGYVAISATVASGVYLDPPWRLFYRAFADRTPVARIGNSIRVYWVDQWPQASAVGQSPQDIDAHGALADALLFGQQWIDLAITHYRTYLHYRPADAQMMTKLGVAIAAQGNVTDAIAVLRQAVALAPDNGWSERVLAEVLITAGYLEDAAQHAERAIELAPSDPAAQDVLGVTLVLRRRPVEARRRFERALQLDSGYVRAREHIERLNASLYR